MVEVNAFNTRYHMFKDQQEIASFHRGMDPIDLTMDISLNSDDAMLLLGIALGIFLRF